MTFKTPKVCIRGVDQVSVGGYIRGVNQISCDGQNSKKIPGISIKCLSGNRTHNHKLKCVTLHQLVFPHQDNSCHIPCCYVPRIHRHGHISRAQTSPSRCDPVPVNCKCAPVQYAHECSISALIFVLGMWGMVCLHLSML